MLLDSSRAGLLGSRTGILRRRPCADQAEVLDLPGANPAELAGNLADLRRVNRLLGGARLTLHGLDSLTRGIEPGAQLTMLDVGTGSGDIPEAVVQWSATRHLRVKVLGVDTNLAVLRADGSRHPGPLAVADGRQLPLADHSFDVAHCSMVLHHLDPGDAVTLLGELARVSRLGVVVNDLVRNVFGLAGAVVLSRVGTRNSLTRHDAPLSVRRAYTVAEMRELAAAAGLPHTEVARLGGYRVTMTVGLQP